MKPRDQAEAGEDDLTAEAKAGELQAHTKTDQLDDTYRFRIVSASEARARDLHSQPHVRVASPLTGREKLPLDDQWRLAEAALDAALAEFKAASARVVDRIKAGEHLPKRELDREWNARLQLMETRQLVERLERLRKDSAPERTLG
jgi:hypothetical protein